MDTGMLHTHLLVVTLYLLQLIIKTGLLLANKKAALKTFTKKLRVPHIILSVLMLLTGIYLLIKSPESNQPYVWIKLLLVFSAIPIGVIAFRKVNKVLAVLSTLFIGAAMLLALSKPAFLRKEPQILTEEEVEQQMEGKSNAEINAAQTVNKGYKIYTRNLCNSCHGSDGDAGYQGAKKLSKTTLSDEEIKTIIRNGKGKMKAYPAINEKDLKLLMSYIRSLRKQ